MAVFVFFNVKQEHLETVIQRRSFNCQEEGKAENAARWCSFVKITQENQEKCVRIHQKNQANKFLRWLLTWFRIWNITVIMFALKQDCNQFALCNMGSSFKLLYLLVLQKQDDKIKSYWDKGYLVTTKGQNEERPALPVLFSAPIYRTSALRILAPFTYKIKTVN